MAVEVLTAKERYGLAFTEAFAWMNLHKVLEMSRGTALSEFWAGVPYDERKQLGYVDGIPIQAPNGQWYALGQLADQERSVVVSRINFTNGTISARVSANIKDENLQVTDVLPSLQATIIKPIIIYPSFIRYWN